MVFYGVMVYGPIGTTFWLVRTERNNLLAAMYMEQRGNK
jgi:hypothetical protein